MSARRLPPLKIQDRDDSLRGRLAALREILDFESGLKPEREAEIRLEILQLRAALRAGETPAPAHQFELSLPPAR
jgi:hypothetical protein